MNWNQKVAIGSLFLIFIRDVLMKSPGENGEQKILGSHREPVHGCNMVS